MTLDGEPFFGTGVPHRRRSSSDEPSCAFRAVGKVGFGRGRVVRLRALVRRPGRKRTSACQAAPRRSTAIRSTTGPWCGWPTRLPTACRSQPDLRLPGAGGRPGVYHPAPAGRSEEDRHDPQRRPLRRRRRDPLLDDKEERMVRVARYSTSNGRSWLCITTGCRTRAGRRPRSATRDAGSSAWSQAWPLPESDDAWACWTREYTSSMTMMAGSCTLLSPGSTTQESRVARAASRSAVRGHRIQRFRPRGLGKDPARRGQKRPAARTRARHQRTTGERGGTRPAGAPNGGRAGTSASGAR